MNSVKIMLAAVAVATGTVALAGPASADDTIPQPVQDCLAAHPGAVTYDLVTDGDDLVCVQSSLLVSPGDDTYLWVGADVDPNVVLRGVPDEYGNGASDGDVTPDLGHDTLSLADWSAPLVETYNEVGVGGIFGVRIKYIDDPETVRYTEHDDVVGDPNLCGRTGTVGDPNDMLIMRFGSGADTVWCTYGHIFTEGGDDTVTGVSGIVDTGAGADLVRGDADADRIVLGSGADRAKVKGGARDVVMAGSGADLVWASRNDRVRSATRR